MKKANIERIEIQEIQEIRPDPKKLPSQTFAHKFERTTVAIQQEKGNLIHNFLIKKDIFCNPKLKLQLLPLVDTEIFQQ